MGATSLPCCHSHLSTEDCYCLLHSGVPCGRVGPGRLGALASGEGWASGGWASSGAPTMAPHAGVAQLAEHPPCKRKVRGSSPRVGSALNCYYAPELRINFDQCHRICHQVES